MSLEKHPLHGIRKSIVGKLPESVVTKWEDRMRHAAAEKHDWTEVNEAVSYGVEIDGKLHLHVPEMLKKRPPKEILALFKEGLAVVATHLETDEKLAQIDIIEGYSWLPYYFPRIANRLGFTITDRDETSKVAAASMTRDEFLKRPWQ